MKECTFNNCKKEGKFALYELRADLTKVWRTDLCSEHEKEIAKRSQELRKEHDIRCFKEVKDQGK